MAASRTKDLIPPAGANLLEYAPQPAVRWEEDENGLIALKWPRLNNRLLKKWLLPRLKQPDRLIHLDAFGSSIWRQMDGHKTVQELARNLQAEFGEAVEPVYERLGVFINLLWRRKFITLVKKGDQL